MSAEVSKGKQKGEGEQRGAVRPGHLRQASVRGTQVQADHTFRSLFEASSNLRLPFLLYMPEHRKFCINRLKDVMPMCYVM